MRTEDGVEHRDLPDGSGRLVARVRDDRRAAGFIYGTSSRPLAELDGDGRVVSRFLHADGGAPAAIQRDDDGDYLVLRDQVGSPLVVVDAASGEIVQEIRYDEHGAVVYGGAPGFQPFGFAGGLHDPATGLIRFGARLYAPDIARWLQADPALFGGLETNLYAYCSADPVNLTDRSGLRCKDPCSDLANLPEIHSFADAFARYHLGGGRQVRLSRRLLDQLRRTEGAWRDGEQNDTNAGFIGWDNLPTSVAIGSFRYKEVGGVRRYHDVYRSPLGTLNWGNTIQGLTVGHSGLLGYTLWAGTGGILSPFHPISGDFEIFGSDEL